MPASQAQELRYPAYQSTTLNDVQGLLDAEAAARVETTLRRWRAEYGVEATVVTLAARGDYGPHRSLESFATGLFDDWGIGDATRDDGVLFLTLVEDGDVRIELGAGYARAWDRAAQQVMDRDILPEFRRRDFAAGIEAGLAGIEARIIAPFSAGAPPPESTGGKPRTPVGPDIPRGDIPSGDSPSQPWPFALMAVIFGVFFLRGRAGDMFMRFRTCPSCGVRGGLRVRRRVTSAASTRLSGSGVKTTRCRKCDYQDEEFFVIPQIIRTASSRSSGGGGGGGFGGGSSGGGGASGRF